MLWVCVLEKSPGASLVVRWLRMLASAGDTGSIPASGGSPMLRGSSACEHHQDGSACKHPPHTRVRNWARMARLSVMLMLLSHWLGQPWGGVASASMLRDQRCCDWPPLCWPCSPLSGASLWLPQTRLSTKATPYLLPLFILGFLVLVSNHLVV